MHAKDVDRHKTAGTQNVTGSEGMLKNSLGRTFADCVVKDVHPAGSCSMLQ